MPRRVGPNPPPAPPTTPRTPTPAAPAAPSTPTAWGPSPAPKGPAAADGFGRRGEVKAAGVDLLGRLSRKLEGLVSAADTIGDIIGAEIQSSGVFGGGLEDWNKRSRRLGGLVNATALPQGGGVTGPAFVREFEALTGAKFSSGNTVTTLADGPRALTECKALIASAETDIKLMTWAFSDDGVGLETARLLIDKAKQGVTVSVMVDGDVAQKPGHRAALALLEQAHAQGLPVQVHRWENPEVPGQGQHMKYLVIDDGAKVISGGRNPGDVYYGQGDKAPWRDMEVALTGPAAAELNAAFVSEWNGQAALHNGQPQRLGLDGQPVPRREVPTLALRAPSAAPPPPGTARTAVVQHVPGGEESNLTVATLKALHGARDSFTLANAYLLSIPAVREGLIDAAKRGVDVRVLTNSAESIDETAITAPILETARALSAGGVKVFLAKNTSPGLEGTSTLHSKYWVADGALSMVQSHNEHPRSDYYEREVGVASLDDGLGASLEADFANATRSDQALAVTRPEDVVIPNDLGTRLKASLITGLFHRQS